MLYIYFVLIIMLEHSIHARATNAIWRGRITWQKKYTITPSPPPPAHTPTHCNAWFLRSRAWLNNETYVGGWYCTHLFGPRCSPAMQGLFAGAQRLTSKCWWWVLVVVERRIQQPTHSPINTHRPVPTRPPCKVCSLTRIA